MTDKVLSLADHKLKNSPHIAGEAFCIRCKYEWIAVAPSGEGHDWMECPGCHCHTGRFVGTVAGDRNTVFGYVFVCPCGNDLFKARVHDVLCPNCGSTQTYAELAESSKHLVT